MKAIIVRNTKKLALLIGTIVLSSQTYAASVGIGLARAPEFSGSSDYSFFPTASFEYETRFGIFKNEQIGFQLDLIKSGSVDTGPILRINTGRDDSVTDDAVAALPEIEATPEVGWFVGSGFKLASLGLTSNAIVIGRLSAVTDIGDGHGGTQINGSVGLVMPINERLRFIPSVSFNYGDDSYTDSFYGIQDANASADLSAYTPSAGVESTQFALVAIRTINERWKATGVFAYTTLQGDAAQSPIVARGDEDQFYSGVTLSYQF